MASPQTLCPKCAFSPIAQGAEKCPRCNEVFAFNPLYKRAQRLMVDKQRGLDFEATLRGGLTGAVHAEKRSHRRKGMIWPGTSCAVRFPAALRPISIPFVAAAPSPEKT